MPFCDLACCCGCCLLRCEVDMWVLARRVLIWVGGWQSLQASSAVIVVPSRLRHDLVRTKWRIFRVPATQNGPCGVYFTPFEEGFDGIISPSRVSSRRPVTPDRLASYKKQPRCAKRWFSEAWRRRIGDGRQGPVRYPSRYLELPTC
jgi:hypothetical protein